MIKTKLISPSLTSRVLQRILRLLLRHHMRHPNKVTTTTRNISNRLIALNTHRFSTQHLNQRHMINRNYRTHRRNRNVNGQWPYCKLFQFSENEGENENINDQSEYPKSFRLSEYEYQLGLQNNPNASVHQIRTVTAPQSNRRSLVVTTIIRRITRKRRCLIRTT